MQFPHMTRDHWLLLAALAFVAWWLHVRSQRRAMLVASASGAVNTAIQNAIHNINAGYPPNV